MSEKAAYIAFCEQTPALPLFYQPWWLDAVTQPDGKKWDVVLARNKQGEIEAVMAYVSGSKLGLRYAVTPQLTQYSGVWIKAKEGESVSERLSREKQLQNEIIRQLEERKIHYFDVKFPLSYQYWSPFYWGGYRQETHYTYQIKGLSDTERVFMRFDGSKQNKIRKALAAGVVIDYEMSADELYDLQCAQLREKNDTDVLSRVLLRSLVDESRRRGQGLIARAKDQKGNTHSAIFVPWDIHSAYDLVTAIHPQYRSSGASTLMVWEAMKKVAGKTEIWDFEGSMIEGVDNSFRQFGGIPVPYYEIQKKSKLLEMIELCKK